MRKIKPLSKTVIKTDTRDGILFILPAVLLYGGLMGLPTLGTLLLSLTRYEIIDSPEFIGFKNILRFIADSRIRSIYMTTLKLVLVLVVQHMVIGLLLALAVNRSINSLRRSIYRGIIFFPAIVTTASVAIAWHYMYNTNFGMINYFLGRIGVEPIPWLTSSAWSVPAIAIFSLWKFVGNSFIYYLIGLQSIDKTYYEAAYVEGAGSFQVFTRITLPMLTPTIFFVMVNLVIGATQIFDEPFLITHGGPGDSSRTVNLLIYETAYQSYDIGYASTIALSLFLLILFLTLVQFGVSKFWVNYESE